jgi:hypothetical protein
MKIDMNNLKTMIFSAKPSDRLVLTVSSLEKNSLQMCQKEIEKFIKKEEDYVVILIRK